jgi:hypothetical protein
MQLAKSVGMSKVIVVVNKMDYSIQNTKSRFAVPLLSSSSSSSLDSSGLACPVWLLLLAHGYRTWPHTDRRLRTRYWLLRAALVSSLTVRAEDALIACTR